MAKAATTCAKQEPDSRGDCISTKMSTESQCALVSSESREGNHPLTSEQTGRL